MNKFANIKFNFFSPRVKLIEKGRKPRALDKCAIASYLADLDYTGNLTYIIYWDSARYDEMAYRLYKSCIEHGVEVNGEASEPKRVTF